MTACGMILAVAMLGLPGGTVDPVESPEAKSVEVDSVPGFSWIEQDTLAAMARPGRERDLEEDMTWLQSAGIRVLVSLTEEPVSEKVLEKYGMEGLHLPVEDFTPPTLAQIDRFLEEVDRARLEGYALGIHCTAGKGRTGTMLAAYLVTRVDPQKMPSRKYESFVRGRWKPPPRRSGLRNLPE